MSADDRFIEPGTWVRPLANGAVLPVLRERLDEWVGYVLDALATEHGTEGHSAKVIRPSGLIPVARMEYRLTVTGSLRLPALWVVPTEDGAAAMAVGTTDEEWENSDGWSDLVVAASRRLDAPSNNYDWHAIIGPTPSVWTSNGLLLDGQADVSGLHLTPASGPYEEFTNKGLPPRLGPGGQLFEFWPVHAEGTSTGFNWNPSGVRDATARLHRLCVLLSLAWESHWTVRQAPEVWTSGYPRTLFVPDGPASPRFFAGFPRDDASSPRNPVKVPPWLESGDLLLASDDGLADAASIYHQAQALEGVAPSIALVAYVAAIEGVAGFLQGVERCETCGNPIGSAARFRHAIATVLSPEEAEQLRRAYTLRSRTAHRGTLHGTEPLLGTWLLPSAFETNAAFDFQWTVLRLAATAARKLLLEQLTA